MKTVTQVQILDEAFCISHCANMLGKDVHLTVLSTGMSK